MEHSCALVREMGAFCWGQNGSFGWGGPRAEPTPIAGLPADLRALTAGANHDCAVDPSGTVYCWGANEDLQCAVRRPAGELPALSTAVVVIDSVPPTDHIAANGQSTCAITREEEVFCWGGDDFGQTGQGLSDGSPRLPGPVVGLSGMVAVTVGQHHACALDRGGAAYCWGENDHGELGVAPSEPRPTAVHVDGLPPLVQISAGNAFTCAVDVSSQVWCWGAGSGGQLGGPEAATGAPRAIAGFSAERVFAGFLAACALDSSDRVWCWGRVDPDYGFFPDPVDERTIVRTPRLTTLEGVSELATSALSWHSCARRASGEVLCWGRNSELQLGRPRSRYGEPEPVPGLP